MADITGNKDKNLAETKKLIGEVLGEIIDEAKSGGDHDQRENSDNGVVCLGFHAYTLLHRGLLRAVRRHH